MTETFSIAYDDCPPSLNLVGSRGRSHWPFTKAKKRWEEILWSLCMGEVRPRKLRSHVHATAVLRFPARRRRDEGNYRMLLEKSLGDALVNGGWLADDTPEHFTFGELTFDDEPGSKRTTITLKVTP